MLSPIKLCGVRTAHAHEKLPGFEPDLCLHAFLIVDSVNIIGSNGLVLTRVEPGLVCSRHVNRA